MWTKAFWQSVAERAIKTFAQSAASILISAGVGLLAADWVGCVSAAGMAMLISVLTSIASGASTDGSPSLAAEKLPDAVPTDDAESDAL